MSDQHVLVTFLGAPDRSRPPTRRPRPHYQEVIYDFRGCKPRSAPGLYTERFFPFALREHLDKTGNAVEEMVVFGTRGSAWDEFLLNVGIPGLLAPDLEDLRRQASRNEVQEEALLKAKWAERVGKALRLGTVQLKVIDYAKELDDQVAIIATLNEATKSATAISIDVTHGLRYMPLLGSLASYVVETTRGSPTLAAKDSAAKVKGVWYGALDLKKPDKIGQEIAPAIDVGGLSRIVDWLAAFKNFEWDGDYSAFAEPLKKGDRDEQDAGKLLAEAAFFERLGRFDEAQKTFKKFDEKIKTVLEKAPGAHGLIGLFKDELSKRIALCNLSGEELYKHQSALAWHHLKHEDVVHAAIWGREAAVTRIVPALTAQYIVWVNNLPETNRNERKRKRICTEYLDIARRDPDRFVRIQQVRQQCANLYGCICFSKADSDKYIQQKAFKRLRNIRNALAHAYADDGRSHAFRVTMVNLRLCHKSLELYIGKFLRNDDPLGAMLV